MRLDRNDLLHIETSALLVIVIALVLPVWASACISAIFGIGKELWDGNHGGVASWHDIICDVLGIAIGTSIVLFGLL